MTAEIFRDRLLASAAAVGWQATSVTEFTEPRFRGREEASSEPLEGAYGLRLGDYPVIVAPITLSTTAAMQAALRRLHAQMVIARSYMRADEVINAHILLCAVNPPPPELRDDASLGDWRSVVDLAQRDETVCRKIIWIPDTDTIDGSYARFLARTFLAMPWRTTDKMLDATLDRNQELTERMLVKHGLPDRTAKKWVELAGRLNEDADALIAALVSAQDEA